MREIYAIAAVAGKRAVIFARAGFTADAISWGDQGGVAMFAFDLQGEPEPVSRAGRALMEDEA